jgi:hypothetical protein
MIHSKLQLETVNSHSQCVWGEVNTAAVSASLAAWRCWPASWRTGRRPAGEKPVVNRPGVPAVTMRSSDHCVMAITYGHQGTMLRMSAEAQSGRHPLSPDTARITRAHKLRQQPAETPGAWTSRGLFLWRSMGRQKLPAGVAVQESSMKAAPG